MEHDDRTRANNLARLRRPRPVPTLGNQLSFYNPGTSIEPLQDMTIAIAISLVKLLQLLEECPIPEDTRHEFETLRQVIALDLDHYRDHRGKHALQVAMQSLYAHLGARR